MLKLEAGKTYLTRDGRKARVLCTDINGMYLVAVALQDKNSTRENITGYMPNGSFWSNILQSDSDLVSEYHEPKYWWVNVYRLDPFIGSKCESKNQADMVAHHYKEYVRIALLKINQETGEAVNEPL